MGMALRGMRRSAIVLLLTLVMAFSANAQEIGNKSIGAGLAMGLAGLGAGIALGIAGAAAMSGMVERPEHKTWYLIYLALGEAVAIYGLLVAILILAAK